MCPIRGGNWNNSANAGVFALNCNNARSNTNTNIGGRVDSDSLRTAQADGGAKGGVFLRRAKACAKSAGRPLSSSCHAAVERLGAFL
jgi:hypothetical protein